MTQKLLMICSVLVFSGAAFAADKSVGAVAIYGNTTQEVEQKVNAEISKMNAGNYYNKTTGRKCDVAKPYNVSFKDAGSSYGVAADGSLVASRPMAWIKFNCTNYNND